MFIRKSHQTEIMDDFSITDDRIDFALKELKTINKYLGGNSTTKDGIIRLMRNINSTGKLKILDIGSGGSDNLQININECVEFQITCLDINTRTCRYIINNSKVDNVICGDAFNIPFKKSSFDIVHASLFLHHFSDNDIKKILKSCLDISKHGIIINDLQRSVLAFAGIKLLTFLFSQSIMVRNDAPLSVKRGFLKSELIKILSEIKCASLILKSKWAFRWLVVIIK